MKWLKRRLQRWLEIDTTLGKAGFESIYYKGVPVKMDTSTNTEFWPEDSHFEEKYNEAAPMSFSEQVTGLGDITEEQRQAARSSEVLMDRVLRSDKWDTPIKKGYEK